jgi:hypothetical protein
MICRILKKEAEIGKKNARFQCQILQDFVYTKPVQMQHRKTKLLFARGMSR